MTTRRGLVRFYLPAWVIALALLYLALPGMPPSAAEMKPVVVALEAAQPASQADLMAARHVLTQRLASYLQGDVRPVLAMQGDRIEVAMPPGVEAARIMAEVSRVGLVELVDGGTEFLTVGGLVKTRLKAVPDRDVYQAVLTNADFVAADARLGARGRPVIEFTLTPAGDARLAAHTAELRGYYLCLAVDGWVVNCPILRTPLMDRRGTIELTGNATLGDARTLAALLHSGSLPVPLKLANN